MNAKQILATLLIVATLGFIVTFYVKKSSQAYVLPTANKTGTPAGTAVSSKTTTKAPPVGAVAISKYIYGNIADISSVTPTTGQKLAVTRIVFKDGNTGEGTVEFGDGTKQYVADFSYLVSAAGKTTLRSFVIRKQ